MKVYWKILKMPKKKFFSSIFSRSNKSQCTEKQMDSYLVTDAVPLPDDDGVENGEINNSIPSSVLAIAEHGSQELVPSPMTSADLYPNSLNPLAPPANSNMLAIHNIHAQTVYQFSNSNNLHFGSVYNIGTSETESKDQTARTSPKEHRYTRTEKAMMRSTEPLNQKYLSEISKHLGEGWQDVMRQLKFSDGQIHQATVDFSVDGGVREVIYQLLLDWTRNDESATLGVITNILWKSGHHETVDFLKQRYKAETRANDKSKSEEAAL